MVSAYATTWCSKKCGRSPNLDSSSTRYGTLWAPRASGPPAASAAAGYVCWNENPATEATSYRSTTCGSISAAVSMPSVMSQT